MKKLFITIGLLFTTYFLSAITTLAVDMTVTCTSSGTCAVSPTGAVFSASTVWYPGMSLEKTVKVINNSSDTQTIGTKSQNSTVTGEIDQEFNLSIMRPSTSTVIWAGTLKNFYTAGEIAMAALAPTASDDFSYTVSMNSSSGNAYQGRQTVFDLLAGFIGSSGGGSSAGAGGGGAPSAPVCSDTTPGSAPTLLSLTTGTNSITLNWSEVVDPVTYYLIAFGTSSGSYSYGNPNIGGKGTTSYTISGLSGGTTYYLVVRAGNGCKAGAFSNELSATPGGGFIAGPPAGFAPGVLGATTATEEAKKENITNGKTPGEAKGSFSQRNIAFNLFILISFSLFGILALILKKLGK